MSFGEETFESKIPDQLIGDYTENEIKEMFVELFFWIAHNRPDWLAECISRKKAMIRSQNWKNRVGERIQGSYRLFPRK